MLYDLRKELDKQRFKARANKLFASGAVVELTEKANRTTKQNSYLHLLIGVVAMDAGVSLDYAKTEYFKRLVNADLFCIEKDAKFAGKVTILRSSADLSKEEMQMAIDRFKKWGADNDIYMPSPDDAGLLREIEIEMGRMRNYL